MTDDAARGEKQIRGDLRALANVVTHGQDGDLIGVVAVPQPGEWCDLDTGNRLIRTASTAPGRCRRHHPGRGGHAAAPAVRSS